MGIILDFFLFFLPPIYNIYYFLLQV